MEGEGALEPDGLALLALPALVVAEQRVRRLGAQLALLLGVAEAAQQAYYYVLDDEKVPVERSDEDRDWITETCLLYTSPSPRDS